MAEHAKPIPIEQQEARDKLWTPEKEASEKKSKLWTPAAPRACLDLVRLARGAEPLDERAVHRGRGSQHAGAVRQPVAVEREAQRASPNITAVAL